MKKKLQLIKIAALVATLSLAKFSVAAPNQTLSTEPKIIKHITVVNDSEITLLPTVEGVEQGCVGGSIPPFLNPITPHTTRDVSVIFIQYRLTCRFNVLPVPNLVSLLQGCRHVKDNDTVTFTGTDVLNLRCRVN